MPTPTYDLIEEQVLSTTAASVTFSSIPGTYKDLVLEIIGNATSAGNLYWQFNGDTATNYSSTNVRGDGTAAGSTRISTTANGYIDLSGAYTALGIRTVSLFSYANTNVNKTWLSRTSIAGGIAEALVGLWRSTAAVTSFTVQSNVGNLASGSTFRLWGVSG